MRKTKNHICTEHHKKTIGSALVFSRVDLERNVQFVRETMFPNYLNTHS